MASKRALRRKACEGKVRHQDTGAAHIAQRRTAGDGLQAYHCRSCGGWHVGHQVGIKAAQPTFQKAVARGRLTAHGFA